jgi:hypothetical protein
VEVSKSIKADVEVKGNYRALKFVLELTSGCKFDIIRAAENIIDRY